MDGFGELLRILLVAVSSKPDVCVIYHNRNTFESFIAIASSSSKIGHSKTLIRVMLSVLNVNQMKTVREMLSYEIESLNADPIRMFLSQQPGTREPFLKSTITINALDLISEIETPYRLQHLARSAIHRTRAGRPLPSAASLPHLAYQSSCTCI